MGIKIISSGLLTTIQDAGRFGYQKEGIIVSGPMDAFALRVANLLVGNEEGAAGIEITFLGPKILFEADHLIALTGGELSPTINGEKIKMDRPIFVPQGSLLQFGAPGLGGRAYVAISGSFTLPQVLGSYATFLRAEVGGFKGRALQAGDQLLCPGPTAIGEKLLQNLVKDKSNWVQAAWMPTLRLFPHLEPQPTLRVIKGPEYKLFTPASQQAFWEQEFTVTTDSDRMGYRLQGVPLMLNEPKEMISSAVTFGTIQVPPEGHPIALLADHQTTGGYPRIGQVITADFSKLAQVPLGQKIRFQEISLEEAQYLYIQQELRIQEIKQAIGYKVRF
ncbi:5-oxoprolinase subunit C family protein [Adhaeribacter radiodurans]|uniref:Biotin-dependent carboxyltransferase family protein n=1 Tax=Adhaeribacter radiodurans TaxID=2745197 RepID=A0A7L7LAV5_9BACT|nr:biotin-dependent carboxyltransferase family protein [Adhaeribacter radiodurans]QMU29966.1 biotin-dependent carboxyltransferase family protein [Adhaeribacter radiodurans]